ncbi:MAG TPA: NIPSNAP family protein [Bryobacteraceae bacterium]|nr:NIPSNAP family protein [Bryobacteraceae bacterium]
MNRREFLATGGVAMSAQASAADAKRSILVLRRYQLRNTPDNMVRRMQDFLQQSLIPAHKRLGVGTVGAFTSLIAPDSPFVLLLFSYPNFAALDTAIDKVAADKEYQKDWESYAAGPLQFVRYQNFLLRGFPTFGSIEVPPKPAGAPRIFELRTYESNNPVTLARKIRMFGEGEIDLFRKLGMLTVFFGETVAGDNMPNLTYMVGFDNLAAREKIWGAFGSSPEWKKLSSQPGVSDAEIVSNISASILRPLPFSDIR